MTSSIGVVIRVLNAAPYLQQSIDSVLGQSLKPSDIIIVDGGSTDGSIEIAENNFPSVKLIKQITPGIGGAAQDGINALGNDIIAFQDADDIWPENRLQQMINALDANPAWDGVMGKVEHFVSTEIQLDIAEKLEVPVGPQPGAGLPSLVIKKSALMLAGPFLEGIWAGEYLEWYDRANHAGVKIEPIDITCLLRRVHLTNTTRNPIARRDYLKALQAVMQRKRAVRNAS